MNAIMKTRNTCYWHVMFRKENLYVVPNQENIIMFCLWNMFVVRGMSENKSCLNIIYQFLHRIHPTQTRSSYLRWHIFALPSIYYKLTIWKLLNRRHIQKIRCTPTIPALEMGAKTWDSWKFVLNLHRISWIFNFFYLLKHNKNQIETPENFTLTGIKST